MKIITLRTNAWHGDWERVFEFPDNVTVDILSPKDSRPLTYREIMEKLYHPFGKSLHELSLNKSNILIVTDDLGRPTPCYEIIPHILKILYNTGLKKENISFLIATGSHRQLNDVELGKKLGQNIVRDFQTASHDAFNSPMVDLGETRYGFPCLVNEKAVKADLIIGIGCVLPHSGQGFGGGAKLFLPGIAGMKSIIAMHGFLPKRGRGNLQSRLFDMRTASESFTDKLPPIFLINTVINTERKICGLFAGSHREVYTEASRSAEQIYKTPIQFDKLKQYSVIIANAYPLDADPVQSDKVKWIHRTFSHCFPVHINSAIDDIYYHGWKMLKRHSVFNKAGLFLGKILSLHISFIPGISNLIMPIMKQIRNQIIDLLLKTSNVDYKSFLKNQRIRETLQKDNIGYAPDSSHKPWFYSEHFSENAFHKKYKMGLLFNDWGVLSKSIAHVFPNAKIAVLPCAPMQIPVVLKTIEKDKTDENDRP